MGYWGCGIVTCQLLSARKDQIRRAIIICEIPGVSGPIPRVSRTPDRMSESKSGVSGPIPGVFGPPVRTSLPTGQTDLQLFATRYLV